MVIDQIHENRTTVVRFYEAFMAADLTAFDRILAVGWINHPPDPGQENTREGFKCGVAGYHTAFEDFHITQDAIVAEHDWVVCRITMTGRQVGEFAKRAPRGLPVKFHGMDMHCLTNGRIAETWHFENYDGLGPVRGQVS